MEEGSISLLVLSVKANKLALVTWDPGSENLMWIKHPHPWQQQKCSFSQRHSISLLPPHFSFLPVASKYFPRLLTLFRHLHRGALICISRWKSLPGAIPPTPTNCKAGTELPLLVTGSRTETAAPSLPILLPLQIPASPEVPVSSHGRAHAPVFLFKFTYRTFPCICSELT